MKLRQRFESWIGTTLDYEESEQIAPETLENLVVCLREGDRSVVNTIIIGHLRLVMAILSKHRSRSKAADVEGAAFLALTETVNNACPHTDKYGKYHPSTLYDNNITAYITTAVKFAIKDEYGNNHIVRVPPRTIRHKIAQGEKFEDIVPGFGMAIRENDPHTAHMQTEEDGDTRAQARSVDSFIMPFYIPIARTEFPAIEFTEILNRSAETIMEQAVLKARSEHCTYEETGKKVGLSMPRVQQLVNQMEQRFDRYNK